MLLQLRGAGSSKILTRVPVPNMMIKSHNPLRLAMPMRYQRPIKSSLSSHVYYKTGPPPKKHIPHASPSHSIVNFSLPGHKAPIKFKSPPQLKTKPEIIYEKVTAPKFATEPIIYQTAIHQIAAPNLSLKQLDNDLTKTALQAFGSALEKPVSEIIFLIFFCY